MVSEAQITANRLNAQKSTGPRTPQGKSIASQNSLTHGLSSHLDVISNEDQAEFDLHRDQLLAELNPSTPMESFLAARVVSLSWRLKRAVSIQNQAISVLLNPPPPHPLSTLADSLAFKMNGLPEPESTPPDPSLSLGRAFVKDLSNSKVLERLLMYERRIEHSLFKTITELQRLTLIRKLGPPKTQNAFRHSEPPADPSRGDEESPAPPTQKPDMSPTVRSRPSEYLAPSSTGGHKIENPDRRRRPRPTSPDPQATIMQNEPNSNPIRTQSAAEIPMGLGWQDHELL